VSAINGNKGQFGNHNHKKKKYAIEVGPGATINTPSFMKIGSGIQTLMGGGHIPPISVLFFFQNKESSLKNCENLCYIPLLFIFHQS
jgi:hypothetical protein